MGFVKKIGAWIRDLRSSADLGVDPASARSRETGGDARRPSGDSETTTGPGENETYVGRVAGQDVGYAGETGAERRAAKDE